MSTSGRSTHKLYSRLARTYHEMYQSIFDYEKEYRFYAGYLERYGCQKILEIGCGSGNLATRFVRAGYDYTGLDLSEDMLEIAREVAPGARFVRGDMRRWKGKGGFDAILITGRTFAYMTENGDVMSALKSARGKLKAQGYLLADNFNAPDIFGHFKKTMVTRATYGDTGYKRVSKNSLSLKGGWTWNWEATYFITREGKTRTVKDSSVLRAFTEDELRLFLQLSGFEPLEAIKGAGAITVVARKGRGSERIP